MASAPTSPPAPARFRLGDQLIQEGLITREQLARGLEEQRAFGGRLGRLLVDLGFLSDLALLTSLSRQLRIPCVDLDQAGVVQADAARYARADLCEQWGFCPLSFDARRNVLLVAVSDPDPALLADIQQFLSVKIEPQLSPQEAIDRAIGRLYHGDGSSQAVKQLTGLQLARSTKKKADNDGLGGAGTLPPQPLPVAPPFDAQLAQQVALQQQLQQQLHAHLQLQQMQHLQLQAQQGAFTPHLALTGVPGAPAVSGSQPPPVQGHASPPPGAPGPPSGLQPIAPAFGPPGYPPMQGYANHYSQDSRGPPAPAPWDSQPGSALAPRDAGAGSTTVPPPSRVAPMLPTPAGTTLEDLAEQLNRLEKTLAAQARALRSLVEVLVDKGVLTKAEMARKQQQFGSR